MFVRGWILRTRVLLIVQSLLAKTSAAPRLQQNVKTERVEPKLLHAVHLRNYRFAWHATRVIETRRTDGEGPECRGYGRVWEYKESGDVSVDRREEGYAFLLSLTYDIQC